jgi:hypothetical protein
LALPLFAITLFVSAFLLFLVRPLIGKMILPKLGGTPQVWNTCMLFFQSALLAGYAYTHSTSTKLNLRRQITTHGVVLFLPFVLFLIVGVFNVDSWIPPAGSNPIFATLLLLTIVVGTPFFVVSTSAPLLQKWFANTGHPTGNDPYFLYGASNLGSLLSLLCYPFFIEPNIPLPSQAWVWLGLYVVFGALVFLSASTVWKSTPALALAGGPELDVPPMGEIPQPPPEQTTAVKAGPAPSTARTGISRKKGLKHPLKTAAAAPSVVRPKKDLSVPNADVVDWKRRLRWILLAFVPSSLMLGVTSYVSVDLSPFPLLWAVPLALYLLSFILVFGKFVPQLLIGIFILLLYIIAAPPLTTKVFPDLLVPVFYILFYGALPLLLGALALSIFFHPKATVSWVGAPHDVMVFLGVPALIAIFFIYAMGRGFEVVLSTWISIAGFFIVTLVCHGELAKDRPATRYLTEYFLLMSVGGALGGLFNALIAPLLFVGVVEYPLAIIAACFLRPTLKKDGWFDELLVSAFPGFGNWIEETGDNLAKSLGKEPPHSRWLLNYSLDIILAVFVFALTFWIRNGAMYSWGWYSAPERNGLYSILRFIGFSETGAAEYLDNFRPFAIYGPALIFCIMFGFGRAVRFGLTMAVLMIFTLVLTVDSRSVVYQTRSYFGVLRVYDGDEALYYRLRDGNKYFVDPDIRIKDAKGQDVEEAPFTYLMHGTTDHGRNYHEPPEMRRVLTTYYHQKGPVGVVMDRYRWFKGPHGTFYADARLPVSLIGLGALPMGVGNLPLDQITSVWSEPPYATIGQGTGTMAGYSRAFQHMTYYEIDNNIRNFSLPPKVLKTDPNDPKKQIEVNDPRFLWREKDPFFTYVSDSLQRGANLEIIMGDARQSMKNERPVASFHYTRPKDKSDIYAKVDKTPEEIELHKMFYNREHYYKVIVVDAFSSDAIPIHLITKEAIQLYFEKLAPDGVLCVHTSNRHMHLVDPVTDIAVDLGKAYVVGHDQGGSRRRDLSPYLGHTGSEYVMLANDKKYLIGPSADGLVLPELGTTVLRAEYPKTGEKITTKEQMRMVYEKELNYQEWNIPRPGGRAVWTDDFSNIISILNIRH